VGAEIQKDPVSGSEYGAIVLRLASQFAHGVTQFGHDSTALNGPPLEKLGNHHILGLISGLAITLATIQRGLN
jgi:hypothetical protein